MLELFVLFVFLWLLARAIGLVLKLTWGAAKITAGVLTALALPLLAVCLAFAGGAVLMVPVAMIALAAGILRSCT